MIFAIIIFLLFLRKIQKDWREKKSEKKLHFNDGILIWEGDFWDNRRAYAWFWQSKQSTDNDHEQSLLIDFSFSSNTVLLWISIVLDIFIWVRRDEIKPRVLWNLFIHIFSGLQQRRKFFSIQIKKKDRKDRIFVFHFQIMLILSFFIFEIDRKTNAMHSPKLYLYREILNR